MRAVLTAVRLAACLVALRVVPTVVHLAGLKVERSADTTAERKAARWVERKAVPMVARMVVQMVDC